MQMCSFWSIFQHPYNCDKWPKTMLVFIAVSELNTLGNGHQKNDTVVTWSLSRAVAVNTRRLQSGHWDWRNIITVIIVKQELKEVFPSRIKKHANPNDKLNGLSYKLWAPITGSIQTTDGHQSRVILHWVGDAPGEPEALSNTEIPWL